MAKRMNLYLPNGYFDFRGVVEFALKNGCPYIFVTGGRGTGKTFGALQMLIEDGKKFMYLRRTDPEVKAAQDPKISPFVKIERELGYQFAFKSKIGAGVDIGAVYNGVEGENGKIIPDGEPLGYMASLSTFAGKRSLYFDDVEVLFYDEFVKEPHIRAIRDEGSAVLNVYETINRNRDIDGVTPPLVMMACSNAFEMANPLYMTLGLVDIAEKLYETGGGYYMDKDRGYILIVMKNSPISEKKKQTASGRLTKGTRYHDIALNNTFGDAGKYTKPASRPLREYDPVCFVGELAVYAHKSKEAFYVSYHRKGTAPEYSLGSADLQRFRKQFTWLWTAYILGELEFEKTSAETLLTYYYTS